MHRTTTRLRLKRVHEPLRTLRGALVEGLGELEAALAGMPRQRRN